MDIKTTGQLRAELSKCFALAKNGELAGDAMRGVIGCANQINTSFAVEIKARRQLQMEGAHIHALGEMPLDTQS